MNSPKIYAINHCQYGKILSRRLFPRMGVKQRGFSFLELVLVIMIISLLFILAIDKLLILRVEAERTTMQQVLGSLRSAMSIDIAAKISGNNIQSIAESEGENPMQWLSERPENYIGVKNEAEPTDIEPGNWYFDKYYGLLIYRVSNAEYFKSSLNGPAIARFRVELDFTDNDDDGEYYPDIDEIHGLRLAAVEPYKWLNEPVTVEDYIHNK